MRHAEEYYALVLDEMEIVETINGLQEEVKIAWPI